MESATDPRILLVEDAESIALALRDFLSKHFRVDWCDSAESGVAKLSDQNYDLLITDIHLPGKSGLQLVSETRQRWPELPIAVITSYDINDFIEVIRQHHIDQVISKHSQMSLHMIYVMARKMITNDIFGIMQYYPDITERPPDQIRQPLEMREDELLTITIRSSDDRYYWNDQIADALQRATGASPATLKLILDELISNALVRAVKKPDGSYKYQKFDEKTDTAIPDERISLLPQEFFTVTFGYTKDTVIIICRDPNGTLEKSEILYRLERHIQTDITSGLPAGLGDLHGRGIFLMREHLSHLIFNIDPGRCTEVICLLNTRRTSPYKDISIYERRSAGSI